MLGGEAKSFLAGALLDILYSRRTQCGQGVSIPERHQKVTRDIIEDTIANVDTLTNILIS